MVNGTVVTVSRERHCVSAVSQQADWIFVYVKFGAGDKKIMEESMK